MMISILNKIVIIPHKPHYIGKYDYIHYGDGGYEELIWMVIIIIIACIAGYLYGFKK